MKRLYRPLILSTVVLLFLLSVLLLLMRVGLPLLAGQNERWSDWLKTESGLEIQFSDIQARLFLIYPQVTLQQVQLHTPLPESGQLSLTAEQLTLELDPWQSLLQKMPVMRRIHLSDADLRLRLPDDREQAGDLPASSVGHEWLTWLQQQREIALEQVHIHLQLEDTAEVESIGPLHLLLEQTATEQRLNLDLSWPATARSNHLHLVLQMDRLVDLAVLPANVQMQMELALIDTALLERLQQGRMRAWLPETLPLEQANLQLQSDWRAGQLQALLGQVELTGVQHDALGRLERVAFDLGVLQQPDGYQVQLQQLVLEDAVRRLQVPHLVIEGWWQDSMPLLHRLYLEQLSLHSTHDWLQQQPWFPARGAQVLDTLSPKGELQDVAINWTRPGDWLSFELAAQLQGVEVSAWDEAPAGRGVDGQLWMNLHEGEVRLDSAAFHLDFPELFVRGGQDYTQASGRVHWYVDEEGFRVGSDTLSLRNEHVSARGRFQLMSPFDRRLPGEFLLMIGLVDSDAERTPFYLPREEMGDLLHDWLAEAIKGGRIREAGLLLHTGLRKEVSQLPLTVQMFFQVDDATFAYQPGWPAVEDGQVFMHLRNDELRLDISAGRLFDSRLRDSVIYLPSGAQQVEVLAAVQGGLQDLQRLLTESPLGEMVGGDWQAWEMKGEAQTQLQLGIPIKAADGVKVKVNSEVSGGRLRALEQGLDVSALQGHVSYTDRSGLKAEGLQGRAFGYPLRARIEADGTSTRLHLDGRIGTTQLDEWLELGLGRFMSGETAWQAEVELCAGADCPHLIVRSNLAGMAVDLPPPLGKSSEELRFLRVDHYPQRARLQFNYADQLRASLALEAPLRGHFRLGSGGLRLPERGVEVDAQLEQLSSEHLSRLQALAVTEQAQATGPGLDLQRVTLNAGRFDLGTLALERLQAVLRPDNQGWRVQLSSDQITGEVLWRALGPHQIRLQELRLPSASDDTAREAVERNGLNGVQPTDLADMDLQIDALYWGKAPVGRVQLGLRQQAQGVSIENLHLDMVDLQVQGQGGWQGTTTELHLDARGGDLGNLLERWELGRALETRSATAKAKLNWSGAPWAFTVATLNGEVEFALSDGRLIESGAGANLLRVFGILNLNTITRRLRLDFSDLLRKGVVFDQLAASYRIQQGVAHTLQPLTLKGPSASMVMEGSVNFPEQRLNKEIQVTLPLGSNLTLGAALLGAPHVAGAIFVVDRIMGERIEQMTGVRYALTGHWRDPQVQLLTAPGS